MLFQKHRGEVVAVGIFVLLFLMAGYFTQVYQETFIGLLEGRTGIAMLVYVLGATVATIIAPLSFLPILPVAVVLWGSLVAAFLSIVAWSLGAAVAFLLARRYGRPLVSHFVGERKMALIAHIAPRRYLFVAVVLLRMALPVDLLSYTLGLLGVMRFWPYMLATVIGITPFALVFSYLAELDTALQFMALLGGVLCIAVSYPHMKRRYRELFQDVA